MRFALLDRITEIVPGKTITAVKNLSMAEEYLADHFPGFPVMPGVLMLEAMVQAGAWLIRATEHFAHSTIVLRRAQNVRYPNFLQPGRQLVVSADLVELGPREARLRGVGTVEGERSISGAMVLERYNLADRDPSLASNDETILAHLREHYAVLAQGVETKQEG